MRTKLAGIVLLVMTVAGGAGIAAAEHMDRGSDKFTDVQAGHWADKAIGWAVDNGITTGTSDTTFSPEDTLTRAQMVTFLHRYHRHVLDAAITTRRGSDKFTDVQAGHWADKAIGWAVDNGITTGTSETTFSPNETLTRAQMVTFLHRYHRNVLDATTTTRRGSDTFTDMHAFHWANNAVGWAVDNGITTGTSETTFSPNETLTRAQMVTFLHRYHRNVAESTTGWTAVEVNAVYGTYHARYLEAEDGADDAKITIGCRGGVYAELAGPATNNRDYVRVRYSFTGQSTKTTLVRAPADGDYDFIVRGRVIRLADEELFRNSLATHHVPNGSVHGGAYFADLFRSSQATHHFLAGLAKHDDGSLHVNVHQGRGNAHVYSASFDLTGARKAVKEVEGYCRGNDWVPDWVPG